jgi:hypothetical protein
MLAKETVGLQQRKIAVTVREQYIQRERMKERKGERERERERERENITAQARTFKAGRVACNELMVDGAAVGVAQNKAVHTA